MTKSVPIINMKILSKNIRQTNSPSDVSYSSLGLSFFPFLTGGASRYHLIVQVYVGGIYLMVRGDSSPPMYVIGVIIFF
jgi:hypothetical protein